MLEVPAGQTTWIGGEDFGDSLLPLDSGGLLPALSLWRRLAVLGPADFGELSYQGTRPLVGHEGLVDVLRAIYRDVECDFLFDPAEGYLLAIEMTAEEDVDPCEIYFSQYSETDGRLLPGLMEVRMGDDLYGVFLLDSYDLQKTE